MFDVNACFVFLFIATFISILKPALALQCFLNIRLVLPLSPSTSLKYTVATFSMSAPKFDIGMLELAPPFTDVRPFRRTIINDALIHKAILSVDKMLMVVLKNCDSHVSMGLLRCYTSELYALLWDSCCLQNKRMLDVRVMLPGEGFRSNFEDLGLEELLGLFMTDRHAEEALNCVNTVNEIRNAVGLPKVTLISLDKIAEEAYDDSCYYLEENYEDQTEFLFDSVACGGTFDIMHNGHKKLLTAAVSCCKSTGVLTVGVTADKMLTHKAFGNLIESSANRVSSVESFLKFIRPGLKYRVVVIEDPYGPPAVESYYDCIVVSSETIIGAKKINELRESRGFKKLCIAVTRRTDAAALSSSAIRRFISAK